MVWCDEVILGGSLCGVVMLGGFLCCDDVEKFEGLWKKQKIMINWWIVGVFSRRQNSYLKAGEIKCRKKSPLKNRWTGCLGLRSVEMTLPLRLHCTSACGTLSTWHLRLAKLPWGRICRAGKTDTLGGTGRQGKLRFGIKKFSCFLKCCVSTHSLKKEKCKKQTT